MKSVDWLYDNPEVALFLKNFLFIFQSVSIDSKN